MESSSTTTTTTAGDRKLWKTSRERERLKARYEIKTRISTSFSSLSIHNPNNESNTDDFGGNNSSDHVRQNINNNHNENAERLLPFFRAIENGKCSAFGIRKLAHLPQQSCLDALHSPSLFDRTRIMEVCVSRFGPSFAKNVLQYLDSFVSHNEKQGVGAVDGVSMVTYAALLGQYQVLGAILLGGANPVHPPYFHANDRVNITKNEKENAYEQYRTVSGRVLTRFFDSFPLTFKLGITRRIVEMRVLGFLHVQKQKQMEEPKLCKEEKRQDSDNGSFSKITSCMIQCEKCQSQIHKIHSPLLNWGGKCSHSICEYCCWEDVMTHIDARDSILCPICQAERPVEKLPLPSNKKKKKNSSSFNEDGNSIEDEEENMKYSNIENHSNTYNTPKERKQQSLHKFHQLPPTSADLKQNYPQNKRKCPKNQIHYSWSASVQLSLGRSQEVRRDKFFTFVEANSLPHVRGCLIAGVDVDQVNAEYHQTNLYIACWMGHTNIVKLLLDFGADYNILANGGLSCFHVAQENGYDEIVSLLRQAGATLSCSESEFKEKKNAISSLSIPLRDRFDKTLGITSSTPQTTILIDKESLHPGAGSCYIDNALSDCHIQNLIDLWSALPVEKGRIKSKDKEQRCSVRSYLCDAEGYLCHLLATPISSNDCGVTSEVKRNNSNDDTCSQLKAIVLSHLRFLHYAHSGSSLPPHVDLNRYDKRYKKRSTHTFILYLSDCTSGGETILLEDVAGEGRNNILAKVQPKKGRLLLFPHMCPHEGAVVDHVPKLLLRGEVMFVDHQSI